MSTGPQSNLRSSSLPVILLMDESLHQLSYSLNSLKGGPIGDYKGDDYRAYSGGY